jgi:transglutaminase-like putative cysteine protease
MRSEPTKTSLVLFLVIFFCLPFMAKSQARAELERLLGKYPGKSMVYDLEQEDITIVMKKGRPVIRMKDYTSRVVLMDNAAPLADYKFYFNKTYQVKDIQAYSLIPDGEKYRKIAVKDFVKSAEIDDGIFYDDNYAYSFTFNSATKGSKFVIESELELTDPYAPVSFSFKHRSPVEKARLSLILPDHVRIRWKLFGGKDTSLVKVRTEKQGSKTLYTWEADDMKEFDQDSQAPDRRYFVPHIIIQITDYDEDGKRIPVITGVDDLYRNYYKNLKDTVIAVNGAIKKLADSLTAGKNSTEEKVNAVFQWVQMQIRYVAIEDGENGVVPCHPELVLQRMYGDCKGKTSLLVSLLRSQGFKVSYAWVGTRALPYRFSDFPARISSNHMVAVWWNGTGNPVILDGTAQYYTLYEIPAGIQGKECLIEKGADDYMVYTIPVAPPAANTCTDTIRIMIDGGTLQGSGKATFTGEQKANLSYAFSRFDTTRYREIVASELSKASNKFIIGSVKVSDPAETEHPFRVSYDFSIPDYLTSNSDRIYLNMNLDRFPGTLIVEEDRTMPVEAEQTFDNVFFCTLKIPATYRPEKIPEEVSFSEPEFGFSQKYTSHADSLTLTTRVYISFQVITGEKIKQFSNMLAALRRAYAKSVVLIKK